MQTNTQLETDFILMELSGKFLKCDRILTDCITTVQEQLTEKEDILTEEDQALLRRLLTGLENSLALNCQRREKLSADCATLTKDAADALLSHMDDNYLKSLEKIRKTTDIVISKMPKRLIDCY